MLRAMALPDAVLGGAPRIVIDLITGRLDLPAAKARGLQYEGDPGVLGRLQPQARRDRLILWVPDGNRRHCVLSDRVWFGSLCSTSRESGSEYASVSTEYEHGENLEPTDIVYTSGPRRRREVDDRTSEGSQRGTSAGDPCTGGSTGTA